MDTVDQVDSTTPGQNDGQSDESFSAADQKDKFLADASGESNAFAEQKPLYRGLWAESIKDGDEIPVGGSIFSDKLDTMLTVDTEWMQDTLGKFTAARIEEAYEGGNGAKFAPWIEKNGIKIDPQIFHKLLQVQATTRRLLQVGDEPVARQRKDKYYDGQESKLSDFVGKSECAEQAVVGKLLLDNIGVASTLMEGVHVDNKGDDPIDHAFLVMDDSQGDGSLIFDIARPKASIDGYPRILRSEKKLSYSTFEGKDNYVVPAVDIYNGNTIHYGVGHSSLMQDVNFADS